MNLLRLLAGVGLVGAGILILVVPGIRRDIDTDVLAVGWPFLVLALGLALMIGSRAVSAQGEVVAIAGGVVFGAGIVLALQNASDNWEAWYVWPLAVFGGAGFGRIVYGALTRRARSLRSGAPLVGAGVVLAFIGAVIEGDVNSTMLAAALVALGIVVILNGLRPRQREESIE